MKAAHKRILAAAAAITTICIFAWLLGVDFNQRGPGTAFTFLWCVMLGNLAYWFPFDEDQ